MASSPPPYTNEELTPNSTPISRPPPPTRRTPSFSSESSYESSSLFSSNDIEPYSPRTPLKFKGVPFCWEQIPGIPKHHKDSTNTTKTVYSEHLLPLPPAGNSISATKPRHRSSNRRRDPFFAALVECSKDDHNNNNYDHAANDIGSVGSKITRRLSDRFGFVNMYAASCKRTCAVSESIVCVPRSSTPHDYVAYRRR